MNAPVIRDLNRRAVSRTTGKHKYRDLRDQGVPRAAAAYAAGIAIEYAATLDAQGDGRPLKEDLPQPENDEAYVERLIALGGLPRLSERLGRLGHTACLPLIPFGARQ